MLVQEQVSGSVEAADRAVTSIKAPHERYWFFFSYTSVVFLFSPALLKSNLWLHMSAIGTLLHEIAKLNTNWTN